MGAGGRTHDVVLDAGDHAVLLHADDRGRDHLRPKVRILAGAVPASNDIDGIERNAAQMLTTI